jgi:adenylate kinase
MHKRAFIFIGRSGCGKGTQVELLKEKLSNIDGEHASLHVQTGQEMRKFVEGNTYTQKLSKEINERGGLQPEFVAIYQWVKVIVERYTGNEYLIFDGTPRKILEANVLNSIFSFYEIKKVDVVHIDISIEEATERLLLRKRHDDTKEDIKNRLSWFETEVNPVIEYFKTNSRYNYHKIDGQGQVEEIFQRLSKSLELP